uniref:SH3 and cysteine-rich domain-containing protein 3-like n=1 Tax=Myxine glutinosa TaxID=7769 RepID=UPI00358F845B
MAEDSERIPTPDKQSNGIAQGSLSKDTNKGATSEPSHCFADHIFKKPTFCDVCHHMIVGKNKDGNVKKYGLRCKLCRINIHHKCEENSAACWGKVPRGFKRHFSTPLVFTFKDILPIDTASKVDPVYETLRIGTSLCSRKSKSENDGKEGKKTKTSKDEDADSENSESEDENEEEGENAGDNDEGTPDAAGKPTIVPSYTYLALYRFAAQEKDDLDLHPGDRLQVIDDSNEEWWKGKIGESIGYFPANFTIKIRNTESVFRCLRTFVGNRYLGQITLKQDQVCVEKGPESNGFMMVTSGRKKGLVPVDYLEAI